MPARWELAELERSWNRGNYDPWSVFEVVEVDAEWIRFDFEPHRIYAPLEHPELPNQFAKLATGDENILAFVRQYGRLGWVELYLNEYLGKGKPVDRWLQDTLAAFKRGLRKGNSERLDWIRAHAAAIGWCLKAGYALREPESRKRAQLCRPLAEKLPTLLGARESLLDSGTLSAWTREARSPEHLIGKVLSGLLWVNLKGVRRRVVYEEGRLRSLWGGVSLLESIYALTADAVTGGRLAQCEASDCGAVFLQTDQRQRFCPPREGQAKSTCMNRLRVRTYRKHQKELRNGTQTRTRRG